MKNLPIFLLGLFGVLGTYAQAQEPSRTPDMVMALQDYFPSMVDVHVEVTYHYMNLEGEQETMISKVTFYLPDAMIGMEGFTAEDLTKRAKAMFDTWDSDTECISAEIGNSPVNFYSIKEPLRLITIQFACG